MKPVSAPKPFRRTAWPWVIAVALVLAAPPALGQKKAKPKPPTKPAPTFKLETQSLTRKAEQRKASILDSIENQRMILDLEPNNAEMKVALANFYWDLSEDYDREAEADDLDEALFQAEKRKDAAKIASLEKKRKGLFDKRDHNRVLTVNLYREVIEDAPKAKKVDEYRYYLGYHLMLMKRGEEGKDVYTELVLQHPKSRYVPDAFVNIGDYYFDINDFRSAMDIYSQAATFKNSAIYGYAIYKQAWCLYNMGEYAASLDRMLKVIKIADEQKKQGIKGAIDLRREAENNLIMPYAKVGKPSAAVAFFKRYTGDRYLELTAKLATQYTEAEDYGFSNDLLRILMKEARKATIKGKSQEFMVIQFQRQLVENAHKQGDKPATVAEVQELIRVYESLQGRAPKKWLADQAQTIDEKVVSIASGYHDEYEATKVEKTLEYTALLYKEYLRLFRDKPNAYRISMNTALLLLLTKRFEEAASEFEKVIAMQPEGEFADDAADRSVFCYLQVLRAKMTAEAKVVDSTQDDLSKKELDADARRFIQAVDRWLEVVKRKGEDPKTAENIPKAVYLAGKYYYEFNHFAEAAERMAIFLKRYPSHNLAEDAALYLLSSYNVTHDVDNLQMWANKIAKLPAGQSPVVKAIVAEIRNEVEFQKCFKHEKAKAHLRAAKCFQDYAREFSNSKKTAQAIYNAAINYFDAKKVELAIETQKKLYEKYKNKDPLAPKALYSIGEIFRETTVYGQAADIYEYFFQNHSKHNLAKKALRFASIFRKTLGEYDKAVRNLSTYLSQYPKEKNAPNVHLDIILIREKQEKWKVIDKAVGKHVKMFPSEPATVRLQVLAAGARSQMKLHKAKQARAGWQRVIDAFKALPDAKLKKLDLKGISAASEANFHLGGHMLKQAQDSQISSTSDKKVKAQIDAKVQLLTGAKTLYDTVIAYGHPGWTIAAYERLGVAYADLADSVENTPTPAKVKKFGEDAIAEFETYKTERADKIRQLAIASYKQGLATARKHRWFNEYAERAEVAVARLDLQDRSVKEYRLRPVHTGPNRGLPDFKEDTK